MDKFLWTKLGKVFDPGEHRTEWMQEFAQGPCVLEFDDFIRIYFSCRPRPDENKQYVSYSAFTDFSRDSKFTLLRVADRPILRLGDTGTFDEFGTYPVSVIREGKEVIAYYAGWTRCESVPFNVAIGRAVSHDTGKTFIRSGNGPVLSFDPEEPFVLSGPKIRKYNGRYYLWYIAGREWIKDNGRPEPVYKIRMASSYDGFSWQREHRDIITSKIDDEAQASPDVFYKNGRYHMFFCYRFGTGYRGKERGYRIGYAWSEDLLHWIRDDERAGIDVSDEGWDSEMLSYPHLWENNGTIYLFYLGNSVGREGFGVARLENQLL